MTTSPYVEELASTTHLTPVRKGDPLSDFRNFLFIVWKHLRLPAPTPIQYDIASYLQHGPRRCIVEAFRGVGKSWITVAFVCWLLLRNPQMQIEVISASKDLADNFTTFALQLINELPILQHLRPRADQRSSKVQFDVGVARASKDPSVKSVGIFGQITGTRADVIIADDIEVPKTSETVGMRDKLAERVKEFDAILKPGGRVIYLGTPQCEMSLYNKLPERGYEIRVWPAEYPRKTMDFYADRLAPLIRDTLEGDKALQGRTTDPKRFSDLDLAERKASYGKAGYALQFMLDTRLSDVDRYPLKLSDLIVMNLNPELAPIKLAWAASPELTLGELPNVGFNGDRFYRPMYVDPTWAPYQGCVMAIDPAGRGKDETGYAIVKMLHGFLFVVAAGGFLGGYSPDTLTALAKLAAQHKVNHIINEANFGDGMFTELLKPYLIQHHPCMMEEVKHNTQKERRIIDVLEPVMMQHRLVIDQKVIEEDFRSVERLDVNHEAQKDYRLMYQLTRITRDKGALVRDDRLDALAIAVQYWVEQMGADADVKRQEHLDELRDKALTRFLEHCIGHEPVEDAWISTPHGNR